MRELYYKMDIDDNIFLVLKRKFEDEIEGEEGFVKLEDVTLNKDISVAEFVDEVEKQKEVVQNYLAEKKAFIESHKGKVLKKVSQRDTAFLNFSHEDILTLEEEVSIDEAKDKHCLKNFKLDPNKIYRGKIFLKVDAEQLGYDYVKVYGVSYSTTTVTWKEPTENWVELHAIKLAIYNKISKIFNIDLSCDEYVRCFHMLKNDELTMKGFLKKISIIKKVTR